MNEALTTLIGRVVLVYETPEMENLRFKSLFISRVQGDRYEVMTLSGKIRWVDPRMCAFEDAGDLLKVLEGR